MLVRVAENATRDTWPHNRRELERLHLGEFAGAAGRVTQRTETTPEERAIFRALGVNEPPLVFDLNAIPTRRRRAAKSA